MPRNLLRTLLGFAGLLALTLPAAAQEGEGGQDLPTVPPLVVVEVLGGRCQYGGCYLHLEIVQEGTWTLREGYDEPFRQGNGQLEPERLETLTALIADADLAALRATPFEGTCPTAVDGPQFVYTFAAEPEPLDSCLSDLEGVALTDGLQALLYELYELMR